MDSSTLCFSGANEQVRETYSSDIVVEPNNDNNLIRNVDSFINRIETIDGVIAATPRNSLTAELSFEDKETTCSLGEDISIEKARGIVKSYILAR